MAILEESKEKYTYEDYDRLPEGAPHQLINGELIVTPAPTTNHQRIIGRLHILLVEYIDANPCGEVLLSPIDVYFSETETYQPDLIYISKDRRNIVGKQKIESAPDLVIEVLSPSTAYYDLHRKKEVYQQSGVLEYWIVDPIERSVEVYENSDRRYNLVKKYTDDNVLESVLLKGLKVPLKKVFGE